MTKETAKELLIHAEETQWKDVLQLILDLSVSNGYEYVIPSIDRGRIKSFIQFWDLVPDLPAWMAKVLDDLRSVGASK